MNVVDLAERMYAKALLETERVASARGALVATEAAAREDVLKTAMELTKADAGLCGRYRCRQSAVGFCASHTPKQVAS